MLNILLIENCDERKDFLSQAVKNHNNFSPETILMFDESWSPVIKLADHETIFERQREIIKSLQVKELLIIADINLDLVSNVRERLKRELDLPQMLLDKTNKTGILALCTEIIRNRRIEKALICFSSTNTGTSEAPAISSYLIDQICSSGRENQIYIERFSDTEKTTLDNLVAAKNLLEEAIKLFRAKFLVPLHYVTEQLLVAQDLYINSQDDRLTHPSSDLDIDNDIIKEGTLFHSLFSSGYSVLRPDSCKALLSYRDAAMLEVEVLKKILGLFNYSLSCSDSVPAKVNLPVRNGIIFIAHLLRFLEVIREDVDGQRIGIDLKISHDKCKQMSINLKSCGFKAIDIQRLENALVTHVGDKSGATTIRCLRELLSCNPSIIRSYENSYGNFVSNKCIDSILSHIAPQPMSCNLKRESSSVVYKQIIKCKFESEYLRLMW